MSVKIIFVLMLIINNHDRREVWTFDLDIDCMAMRDTLNQVRIAPGT